jgi:nitroreductase
MLVHAQRQDIFRRLLEAPERFTDRLMRLYEELGQAPCFIVLCRERRVDLAAQAFEATVRDWELCSIGAALANLMAEATALGLGTRWFGSVMMEGSGAPLCRLLRIPDDVEMVAVTPLGYHHEPLKERPVQPLETLTGFRRGSEERLAALLRGKLGLEDVVHYDGYGGRGEA